MPKKILILGGTTEARLLAKRLLSDSSHSIVVSLAGALGDGTETAFRKRLGPVNEDRLVLRIGGFGSIDGLRSYLNENSISLIVDATHPYAAQISHNAVSAASIVSVPLVRYERPAWLPEHEASWIEANDLAHAATLIPTGARVLLAVGRQSAAPFSQRTDCAFVLRSVAPANATLLGAHFSFVQSMPGKNIEEEIKLIQDENISCLITKNSGAVRSFHKVSAAQKLGLPIIMISRPSLPVCCTFNDLDTLLSWIDVQPPS